MLEPVRLYHNTPNSKDTPKTKRTKKTQAGQPNAALALDGSEETSTRQEAPTATSSSEATNPPTTTSAPPPILQSICIGINATTKALERSIQDVITYPPPSAIFLCKADLAPAHLYNHLGPMAAIVPTTLLFPLHKGSEQKLSQALGMKAVGAITILAGSKEAEDLILMLKRMVEPISVSWLPKIKPASPKKAAVVATKDGVKKNAIEQTSPTTPAVSTQPSPLATKTEPEAGTATLIPTNIKSVKTTMPIITRTPKEPVETVKNGGNMPKPQPSQVQPGQKTQQKGQQKSHQSGQQNNQQKSQQRSQQSGQQNNNQNNQQKKRPTEGPAVGRDKDKRVKQ